MAQQLYFVNCSSSESLCESPEGIFSAAPGVCDASTGICACPAGYNGEDMFAAWNDCHVQIYQRDAFERTILVLMSVVVLATIMGIFKLLHLWGIIYWESDEVFDLAKPGEAPEATSKIIVSGDTVPLASEMSNNSPSPLPPRRRNTLIPSVDIGELQAPRPNARTNTFQQLMAERKRRRNTLTLLIVWLIFGVFGVVFQSYRALGYRLDQQMPMMFVSLAIMMTSIITGLWMISYTWFSNLPSLRMFAVMFPNIPGVSICKHPNILKAWMWLNLISIGICSMVILIIWPLTDKQNINHTTWCAAMVVLSIHILTFGTTHLVLSVVLIKLFTALKNTSKQSSDQVRRTRGESTVKFINFLTLFSTPSFSAFAMFMAFHPVGFRYSYFFFTVLLAGGSFSALIATYIFVFRMGSRKRVRKGSGSNTVPPMERSPSKKSFNRGSVGDAPVV
jgi:hypothetical protein